MYQTQKPRDYVPFAYILNKDCGFQFISPTLTSSDLVSEFRFLPLFDEQGNEILALLPDGASDPSALSTALGNVFCCTNIFKLWNIQQKQNTFMLTVIQPTDKTGEPLPPNRNPVDSLRYRLFHKIETERIKQKMGQKLDMPLSWFNWQINRPTESLLVQAMALKLNGKECLDINKKPIWKGPYVLVIPGSAETGFKTMIAQKHDDDKPLTPANCSFGDFITCNTGCTVILSCEKAENKATYTLSKGRKYPIKAEDIQKLSKPWEDIIRIPYVEETIQDLVTVFGKLAVDFGLRGTEFEAYIPDDCKDLAENMEEPCMSKSERERMEAAGPKTTVATKPPTKAPVVAEPPVEVPKDEIPYAPVPEASQPVAEPLPAAQATPSDPARYQKRLADMKQKQIANAGDLLS